MMQTVKMTVKYLCLGISLGCTCFVLICLIGFWTGGEAFLSPIMKDFSRQTVGAVIVGIACASTAAIYKLKGLTLRRKILIHFIVGMGVFFAVSLYLGWISFHTQRIFYIALQLLIFCGIFVVIWLCFYLYNWNDARKINDQLQELELALKETKQND